MLDAYRMPDGFELEEGGDLPRALAVWGAVDDPLHVLRGELLELRSLAVGAREVEGVDVHVPREPGAQLLAVAGQEVDDPAGHIRGGQHLGQLDRGERMGPGGYDDGRVPPDDHRRHSRDEAQERRLVRS